jgi:hypothetical protein
MNYIVKHKDGLQNNFERRKALALAGRKSEKRKQHRFIKPSNLAADTSGREKAYALILRGIKHNPLK